MTDNLQRGRFITFEGGEGVGKSTQATGLRQRLQAQGKSTHVTREPGGSPFAETVRELILDPATPPHPPLAEALLFCAARTDHIETVIRPRLTAGDWVICDRFMDSTRAYQGAAGGLTADVISTLETLVVGSLRPDLTIILDLGVDTAFARVLDRANSSPSIQGNAVSDPYEMREMDFHHRLRQGFLDIAAAEPARCVVVDASQDANIVADEIWQIIEARLPIEAA